MKRLFLLVVGLLLLGAISPRVGAQNPGINITPTNPAANFTGNNLQAATTVTITPTNLPQGQSVTVTLEVVYTRNQGSQIVTTFAIVGTTLVQPGGTSQRNNVVSSGAVWTVNINFNRLALTGGTGVIGTFKVDARYGGGVDPVTGLPVATVRAQSVTGTVNLAGQQQNQQQGGGQQNQQQGTQQQGQQQQQGNTFNFRGMYALLQRWNQTVNSQVLNSRLGQFNPNSRSYPGGYAPRLLLRAGYPLNAKLVPTTNSSGKTTGWKVTFPGRKTPTRQSSISNGRVYQTRTVLGGGGGRARR